MSRTTYALVAYKQNFPEDMPKEDIMLQSRELAKELNELVNRHGAELCTIGEVLKKADHVQKDHGKSFGISDFAKTASDADESEIFTDGDIVDGI